MEVKGILDKIRHQEKEEKEYFFALEIGVGIVKSAVWMTEEKQIKIVAIGSNQRWEEEEELLGAVDASLSSAAEEFAPGEEIPEPNKVIFGLPQEWIKADKILPEKLKILKKLSQKLELEPVGFVVTTEAITHYLKTTEGVPPTAVLIALAKTQIFLTLLQLGKSSLSQSVKRSQNLGDDVIEGLSRFEKKGPFPARILLYNSEEELEEIKQDLVDYPWQEEKVKEKEVTFLHLPKIEILSSDFDIKAVALAGGKEVARAAGIMADFLEEKEKPALPTIAKEKKEVFEKVDFGFVKGKDVLIEEKIKKEIEPEKAEETIPSKEPLPETPTKTLWLKPFLSLSWLKRIDFSRWENRAHFIIGAVLAALFTLGGIMIALYWYLPKASIVLLVEPKVLEEEFEIKLDPSLTMADKEKLALPAQEVEEVVQGEKTIETTGTKITGEKARGEVTIYNRTANQKTFPAGTEISGPNELKFTLDEKVSVASESAGPDYTKIPGKATVGVTAVTIGTEGNLAGGTEFSIANFSRSDFVGQNESAFTGGTSREVQVVAVEDQENLLASLTEELESQANTQIEEDIPSGRKLLAESLQSSVISKTFSKKVDEEATEVSLNLKSKFTAFTYSEDELRTLIDQVVEDKIPAGFEFRKEESQTEFELKEVTGERIAVFKARLLANLVPLLDLEKIKQDLVGKYPFLGKAYLDNLPNVVATEIKIRPPLPGRLLTFPRIAKNINIEIQVKE